jgi:hypothetical protein
MPLLPGHLARNVQLVGDPLSREAELAGLRNGVDAVDVDQHGDVMQLGELLDDLGFVQLCPKREAMRVGVHRSNLRASKRLRDATDGLMRNASIQSSSFPSPSFRSRRHPRPRRERPLGDPTRRFGGAVRVGLVSRLSHPAGDSPLEARPSMQASKQVHLVAPSARISSIDSHPRARTLDAAPVLPPTWERWEP